jgi:hypothetical protein
VLMDAAEAFQAFIFLLSHFDRTHFFRMIHKVPWNVSKCQITN